MKEISIIILTHNAPQYVEETLETLHNVTNKTDLDKCEIIVIDNASGEDTVQLVKRMEQQGYIDKLYLSPQNLLFAGGNNLGAKLACESSKYYLLLNSDVKINDPDWLRILVNTKKKGNYAVCSYGYCEIRPSRADGYCFLIERELYDEFKLDEQFAWWWSITRIQAQILATGRNILAYRKHDKLILHYGGKSGNDFKDAKGMETSIDTIMKWFEESSGKVIAANAYAFRNLLCLVNNYR